MKNLSGPPFAGGRKNHRKHFPRGILRFFGKHCLDAMTAGHGCLVCVVERLRHAHTEENRRASGKEEKVNIVACVKQVPDTEAQIKVKPDGSGIEEGGIKWVMNPYDEFGVEEALRLKEKNGGDVTIRLRRTRPCHGDDPDGPGHGRRQGHPYLRSGIGRRGCLQHGGKPWRRPLKGFPMTSSSAASGPSD